MKKSKKYLALALAALMTVSSFTGCGSKEEGSKSSGNKTEIEISYWNSGLGTDWLDAMIDAFEDKYPDYKVKYNATASDSATVAAFGKEGADTTDLYLATTRYAADLTESLDDVLDTTVEGESKSIREKFNSSYLDLEKTEDGSIHELTYGGGSLGFVYNTKLFEQAGIDTLPRTTDELVKVCDTLYTNDITPLCHFKGTSYLYYISDAWRLQYDGMDYILNNFYSCTDENGKSPSKDALTKQDGRYEVLKVFEKLITPDYVLAGSNTQEITSMQTKFLQGSCAMMITGAWAANEMSSVGKMDDFSVMKTPVVSSITDKLTTVTKEKELRAVISAIDAVTDGEKDITEYQDGENYLVDDLSVSAEDWEYIRKARNTTPANYAGETLFIPTYAEEKEGAKKFLTFLYSDEGYRIYTDYLHISLPLSLDNGEIDTTEWNDFEASMYELTNKTEQIASSYIKSEHRIFYAGGAQAYGSSFGNFCANNAADRLTADSAWEATLNRIENEYEKTWLANIGE